MFLRALLSIKTQSTMRLSLLLAQRLIDNKCRELMQSGKMKNGVLTEDVHEDVQFGSPSTAAKVLIGNSVNEILYG